MNFKPFKGVYLYLLGESRNYKMDCMKEWKPFIYTNKGIAITNIYFHLQQMEGYWILFAFQPSLVERLGFIIVRDDIEINHV